MADRPPSRSLSSSEQAAVQAALAQHRARTTAQIAGLTKDFDGIVEASQLVNADDEHDPDGATIAFERAQVSSLLKQVLRNLVDLDQAEQRLADGVYGLCETCGHPIDVERLVALPTAKTCINCAVGSGPFLRRR
jgi:RNA polymerase-binding transcription factor DksA